MSYLCSSSTGRTNVNLVEQVLEQGQRLRNAMVQSILNNDPYYSDLTPRASQHMLKMHAINMDEETERREVTIAEKHKFISYLKGDDMSRDEEKRALETFRAMSNTDICEVTERSYASVQNSCDCDTCKAYYKKDFSNCAMHDIPPLNLKTGSTRTKTEAHTNRNHPFYYLKYVDTLKIAIHSLKLSHEGNVKVSSSLINKSSKYPQNLSTTYFIEYDVPSCLVKNVTKKAKVNTGLESNNIVKLCSKKLHKEAIYFKQISIHDVSNLDKLNLDAIDIKFQVSCRTLKQKGVNVIGHAKFNMGSFKDTKYLSCNQELVVLLKQGTPIVIGTIKIALQLGCGRLYYGKEFMDSIRNDKENNVVLPEIVSYEKMDDLSDCVDGGFVKEIEEDFVVLETQRAVNGDVKNLDERRRLVNAESRNVAEENGKIGVKDKEFKLQTSKTSKPCRSRNGLAHIKENVVEFKDAVENPAVQQIANKTVLFGFIYISEVLYLDEKANTYFTCQPFCQNDLINSNVINGGSNPVFNFHQRIPIVYEEEFLSKLRDNFMIFEFWEKLNYKEDLIGVCSIPLHQYYLAFRNPVIVKYLDRNKLPVIGTDWYEPISDPTTGGINGQVQILIALGSETQVHNLENERGFRDNIVLKAKRTFTSKRPLIGETHLAQKPDKILFKNPKRSVTRNLVNNLQLQETNILDKEDPISSNEPFISNNERLICNNDLLSDAITTADKSTNKIDTIDKASQSDPVPMDNQNTIKENVLDNILQQFIAQQQCPPHADIGTNTDPPILDNMKRSQIESQGNYQKDLRKTTDLLDCLNKALKIDAKPQSSHSFKAHIVIESALHLPSRRKCKAKKVKGKHIREEILPSTYVTFETDTDGEVKVTQIVQKCTSPKWDYRCDVSLPSDLLVNNQKRLIFKVWKKANFASMQPNMQVDGVLGFAALDLTVFLAGLPTVQGWFNIIDFSSKCNGQIKINVTPLENISRFSEHKHSLSPNANTVKSVETEGVVDEPGEVLSRALKRKFTELDEITQRLRSRLSRVTNEESDTSNDDMADEFEKDINTLCVEDDYDMVNFVREAHTINMQQVSSSLMKWQGVLPPDNQTLLLYLDDEPLSDNEDNRQTYDLNKLTENLIITTTMQNHLPERSNINALLITDTQGSVQKNVNSLTGTKSIVNFESQTDKPRDAEFTGQIIDVSASNTPNIITNNSTLNTPSCSKLSEDVSAATSAASITTLDKQLVEGKHRIDTLLEKLSLISKNDAEPFSSRYVSGCSVSQDADLTSSASKNSTEDDILQELGIDERQFDANCLFDSTLLAQYKEGLRTTPTDDSEGSVISSIGNQRDAPDGEGSCRKEG